MLKELKAFLMRGNVVDLAVAVVIGLAFAAVITAFVDGIISPIIGLVGGGDFNRFVITLTRENGVPTSQLLWGAVVTQIINFVLVAAAIFFLVVKPVGALIARRKAGEEEAAEPTEAELLAEIRDLLRARQP